MSTHNCRCAEAVKQNDVRKASRIIAELRALTSPSGSGAQRMAHYFTDALVRFLPSLCTLSCFSCDLYWTLRGWVFGVGGAIHSRLSLALLPMCFFSSIFAECLLDELNILGC
jgi:hypothetical protein